MEINLNTIVTICTGLMAVFAFVGQLKGFFSSGEKELKADIAELELRAKAAEEKLAVHSERIQAIESDIKHLPDRETAHRLELNLEKLSSQVAQLNERMKPIAVTSDRMMELLLEQAK